MTPEQHAQRIRAIEWELYKADYGMGMPRNPEHVAHLRKALEDAREAARIHILESMVLSS
jgi:hypothetical protein